jgi:hypothetical protein
MARAMHSNGMFHEAEYFYLEAFEIACHCLSCDHDIILRSVPDFFNPDHENLPPGESVFVQDKAKHQEITCIKQPVGTLSGSGAEKCPELNFVTLFYNLSLLLIENCSTQCPRTKERIILALRLLKLSVVLISRNPKFFASSFHTMILVVGIYNSLAKALCLCDSDPEGEIALSGAGIQLDKDWFELQVNAVDLGLEYFGNHPVVSSLLVGLGKSWLYMGMDHCADETFDQANEVYTAWEGREFLRKTYYQESICAEAA